MSFSDADNQSTSESLSSRSARVCGAVSPQMEEPGTTAIRGVTRLQKLFTNDRIHNFDQPRSEDLVYLDTSDWGKKEIQKACKKKSV